MSVVRATPPVRHSLGSKRQARRSGATEAAANVRLAGADEIRRWDGLILQSPDEGNVYRGSANIDGMVCQQGVTPVYLIVNGHAVTTFRVEVPLVGAMWVLFGPPVEDAHELAQSAKAVAAFAEDQGVTAVRLRTQLKANSDDANLLRSYGLTRVPAWLDDSTVIVDLSGSELDVQARFKKRARKSIRRAAQEGVTVDRVPATDDNCRILYEMLDATSGGRFQIPDLPASAAVFQRYEATGDGQLFLARHEGDVVVGAFVAKFGKTALYLGAGSVRKQPGDPTLCGLGGSRAAYALQWEIMRWAREQGCDRYDLDGTPSSSTIADETHPRHGVGQFKTAFSHEITDYLGAYQIAVRPRRAWALLQLEICAGRVDESPVLNRLRHRPVRPNPDYVWLHRGRRGQRRLRGVEMK
ncbi:peptidoglycan bridge formation glycyltransferase FemA/FemB family protein [Williamsia sp. 1135]|uniref:lipid II:glycine glycyltransferase FemX n=1 Tax=Williamsia sp. 1135 TaxID=1889262 RepID=UPI00117FD362|nr:peptidoglycan bridge formation glycyltransferase FemA/FemB family protein [Williamsia sp. 1135]